MPLPFWDPGAIPKVTTSERDPETGKLLAGERPPPAIVSALPENRFPYPEELSNWDFIELNGARAPGMARLEGERKLPYDKKAALGLAVGRPDLVNFDPVEFTLTLTLWTPAQWDELQVMLPDILPAPGPNPEPRQVNARHPSLFLVGVSVIYVQRMGLPKHLGKQIIEIPFTCYEWQPELPMKVTTPGNPINVSAKRPGNKLTPTKPTPPSQTASKIGPS